MGVIRSARLLGIALAVGWNVDLGSAASAPLRACAMCVESDGGGRMSEQARMYVCKK